MPTLPQGADCRRRLPALRVSAAFAGRLPVPAVPRRRARAEAPSSSVGGVSAGTPPTAPRRTPPRRRPASLAGFAKPLPHSRQHLAPALRGLPNPVLDREEALLSAGVDADHHQHAQPALVAEGRCTRRPPTGTPSRRRASGRTIPGTPRPTPSSAGSPRSPTDRAPPRPPAPPPQDASAPSTPVQAQPRNRRVHARAAANVRGNQGRPERLRRPLGAAGLRNLHLHRADLRQDRALRKVPVAHHAGASRSPSNAERCSSNSACTAASIRRFAPVRRSSVRGSETVAGAASSTALSLSMCGVLLLPK